MNIATTWYLTGLAISFVFFLGGIFTPKEFAVLFLALIAARIVAAGGDTESGGKSS